MSRLGGWVRWIGCAAVWEAGRAVCGERHLRQIKPTLRLGLDPTVGREVVWFLIPPAMEKCPEYYLGSFK